jgi:tRNA(Ile2)-agmatinylcytidine synthase
MKSEGKGKGFQCKQCKLRAPRTVQKDIVKVPRSILPGLYIPTPKAHRHLTKPLHRYGLEKKPLADYSKNFSAAVFQFQF